MILGTAVGEGQTQEYSRIMSTWMWFALQVVCAGLTLPLAWWLNRRGQKLATGIMIASLCILLLWPLMRFFPVEPIRWLGARTVSTLELTGLFIPASLLFFLAAYRTRKPSEARGLRALVAVSGVYFVRAGWWMVGSPVPDLGATLYDKNVCIQKTGYTCVAASAVTMLRSIGVDSTETEMARLCRIDIGGGATDSRAVWGLEEKLEGTGWHVRYEATDFAGLVAARKPCMVQIGWGYFMAHMVTVLEAGPEEVVLGDPLRGRVHIRTGEFVKTWKGRVISLGRNDESMMNPGYGNGLPTLR